MKYSAVFVVAGIALATVSILSAGWALLLLWPAVDLGLLALAYGLNRATWFGKQANGRMQVLRVVIFAPYLVLTWLCWCLYVRLGSEAWSNEVAPGLWVGRRPAPTHVPDGAHIVDMTAEFPAHSYFQDSQNLQCLPTLDARSPGVEALRSVALQLASMKSPVYVHCAQGHGRSATLAAVTMVLRGDERSIDGAMKSMRAARPRVHLHSIQRMDAEAAVKDATPLLENEGVSK